MTCLWHYVYIKGKFTAYCMGRIVPDLTAAWPLECARFLCTQSFVHLPSRMIPAYFMNLRRIRSRARGLPYQIGVGDFIVDLRLLYILRGCDEVVQIFGIVSDGTRKNLRSHLDEPPTIVTAQQIFETAEVKTARISWSRQIIKSTSVADSKNCLVGVL